jgi:hypothetical protein
VWVQDITLSGSDIDEIRQQKVERSDVSVGLLGLGSGRHQISPYNTWQGQFGESFEVYCDGGVDTECIIPLPNFTSDIEFRINRL